MACAVLGTSEKKSLMLFMCALVSLVNNWGTVKIKHGAEKVDARRSGTLRGVT